MNLRQIREDLERDEGWREFIYDDATGRPIIKGSTVEGYPTIGLGFCVSADRGAPLPRNIADRWMDHILVEIGKALDARIPWWRDQPDDVQRALVNMAYQLGVAGLLNFRKMLAALERGDRLTAAAEALDSIWAKKQTPARARRIAALIGGDND